MDNNIKRKLMTITGLAYSINETTKATCFVRYSGHVNYIDVDVFKNGWEFVEKPEKAPAPEYSTGLTDIAKGNLDKIIKDLLDIQHELVGGKGDF